MKRYLALFLSLVMILCALPLAIAEDVENPYEDDGIVIYRDADGNVIDLGGMEITVCDWWSSDWHDDEPTTGGDENYVWILRAGAYLAPFKAGLFYDLSTLDCLDFSDEKWNGTVTGLLSKDGGIYGMRPEKAEPRKGVFFNKRLLNDAGVDPEEIYDLQAKGEWTWEAFEALCEKLTRDTDNDGVIDRYAMMSFSSHLLPAALVSNGAGFVQVDENGKYYNAAETDAFLEAMNWVMDMVSKYEMKAPEGAEWNYFESAFINGEVALQVHEDYFATMASCSSPRARAPRPTSTRLLTISWSSRLATTQIARGRLPSLTTSSPTPPPATPTATTGRTATIRSTATSAPWTRPSP